MESFTSLFKCTRIFYATSQRRSTKEVFTRLTTALVAKILLPTTGRTNEVVLHEILFVYDAREKE